MEEYLLDPKTKDILKAVYPDVAERMKRVYADMRVKHGFTLRATQGIRTFKFQEDLYAKGRTAPGPIVTYSRPGDSVHHYGLAVDSCFVGSDPFLIKNERSDAIWRLFGQVCRDNGLEWGGNWRRFVDRPHAQNQYGLSLQQIKDLYRVGGLTAIWSKVDQLRGIASEAPEVVGNVRILGSPPPANG